VVEKTSVRMSDGEKRKAICLHCILVKGFRSDTSFMNSLTVEGEAKTKVDSFHFEATSLNLCRYLSFLKIYFIVIKIKSFNTIHRQELNNPFFLEWYKTR
jgi:hypothetical protein